MKYFISALKWITGVLGALTVVIGGIVLLITGAVLAYGYLTVGRFAEDVVVEVSKDEGCTAEFPVRVAVLNGSSRAVHSVTFQLRAFEPDHTTNLAGFEIYNWDRVVEPRTGYVYCYSPRMAFGQEFREGLEWYVDDVNVSFNSGRPSD
jgi:hypothetical protein